MNTINIGSVNGKSIVIKDGESFTLKNGKMNFTSVSGGCTITINGKESLLPEQPHVHITGTEIDSVEIKSGNLTINGNVQRVEMRNGNITVHGNVEHADVKNGNLIQSRRS